MKRSYILLLLYLYLNEPPLNVVMIASFRIGYLKHLYYQIKYLEDFVIIFRLSQCAATFTLGLMLVSLVILL